jgi:hypothetical protein
MEVDSICLIDLMSSKATQMTNKNIVWFIRIQDNIFLKIYYWNDNILN